MDALSAAVLVAEDDAQHALHLLACLRATKLANPVVVVGSGEEAVAYLGGEGPYADRRRHPPPVLALVDLDLPGMSGLDVVCWMRERFIDHWVPVILTTSGEASDLGHALSAGARSYLVKPVGLDALLEAVRNLELPWVLIDGSRTRRPPPVK